MPDLKKIIINYFFKIFFKGKETYKMNQILQPKPMIKVLSQTKTETLSLSSNMSAESDFSEIERP